MARKIDKIKVFTCSLTDKIYVGYLNKLQGFITNRVEVTDQVLTAVMQYMDNKETPFEITCAAGTLKWIPKKGVWKEVIKRKEPKSPSSKFR